MKQYVKQLILTASFVVAALFSILFHSVVVENSNASIPPEPTYELVCCGPQCAIGGVPANYCLGDVQYTCCFDPTSPGEN